MGVHLPLTLDELEVDGVTDAGSLKSDAEIETEAYTVMCDSPPVFDMYVDDCGDPFSCSLLVWDLQRYPGRIPFCVV